MDRGLLVRALIIGFICFIVAVGGLYYLSLAEEQSNRQYQEIYGTVSNNSDGIGAIGLLMLVIVGFFVLMIVAGALTALVTVKQWNRPWDIFRSSALAGGTPVVLLWVIFWCLTLANIIGIIFNHEPFSYNDLVFFVFVLVINVLMVGLGALIAGLSGQMIRMLARGVARLSG